MLTTDADAQSLFPSAPSGPGIAGAGGAAACLRPRASTYVPYDWDILSRRWHPIAAVRDLGDKPMAVTLLDVALVVYRIGGEICVARDVCPHRGVPLSLGWVEDGGLVCAYHGLKYGADGRCLRIPSQPDMEPPPRFHLSLFPAAERYGLIWTCLNPVAGAEAIPPFPEWDDPDYQPILPPFVDIAASPGRQMEGFVDVAHFAWVHHESFADRALAEVPTYSTTFTDYGLRTEYWSDVSNYPKGLGLQAPEGFRWLRVFDIHPPFCAILTVHFPDEGRLRIMNIASPVSARKTRLFVPLARNFDVTGSVEDVYAFNAQIFAEDQAIVEQQKPEDLPLDMAEEAHFPADKTSVGYRRLLKTMGLSLAFSG